MVLPRKFPVNAQILRKIEKVTGPVEGQQYLVNRNPRNLEFLRIAHKPEGYRLDKFGRCFWNKLTLESTGKHVTARMVHFEKGPIIEASTNEWAIKKQLFKTSDKSAYHNLGEVFAQRCLESGFIEMACIIRPGKSDKVRDFLNVVKKSGIILKEFGTVKPDLSTNPWLGRKMKPYGDWEEH